MKLSFTFELSDWMAFQKYYLFNSRQYKNTRLLVASMMPMVSSAFLMYDYFSKGRLDAGLCALFIVLSAAWIVFYPKRYENSCIKKIVKILNDDRQSSILGMHELDLSEDGIIHKEPESLQQISWKGITRAVKTDDYYFLFTTSISAIVIPIMKLNLDAYALRDLDDMINMNVRNDNENI